ncbi:hypothetical protein AC781_07580 [Akkermansia glycaniphila]|nr:hypothetical protein AC781_07580 [Akkermansia glycaniphila]
MVKPFRAYEPLFVSNQRRQSFAEGVAVLEHLKKLATMRQCTPTDIIRETILHELQTYLQQQTPPETATSFSTLKTT